MTDEELRSLEREIIAAPADLELRRRHAQLLLRAGDEDRGLAALDLAWRLGADDLWEDLCSRLDARRIFLEAPRITLCYVPSGPFAMGSDELDEDAKPLHLVHLSAFYVARDVLTLAAEAAWRREDLSDVSFRYTAPVRYDEARDIIETLARANPIPGRPGRWALVSEAQWERVFRAAYLRPNGISPYGVVPCRDRPEWTSDHYSALAYDGGPRRDPCVAGARGLHSVRGVPHLPAPYFALYREAARTDGSFNVGEGKTARHEAGIAARPVYLPTPGERG
ncbi:hypothetical protein HY251_11070 [bacterium]|nr:hypothetical protein [bacterium]